MAYFQFYFWFSIYVFRAKSLCSFGALGEAGTVKEMHQLQGKMPVEIYLTALRIVTILDGTYGADRDVDHGDGGFVLIAENVQDLAAISQQYVDLDSNRHEAVSPVQCENRPYINALFLCNNEFGINVLMPVSIAPSIITEALKGE